MITQQTNTNPVADGLLINDTDVIGSRLERIDPAIFSNQSAGSDGPTASEDDEADTNAVDEDEPTDEDGDPTGKHDHNQDDNYALGGHVTRSGGV